MTLVQKNTDGSISIVGDSALLSDGSRASRSTIQAMTPENQKSVGFYEIADPSTPAGQILTGVTYSAIPDGVQATGTFAAAPVQAITSLAFRQLFTAAERLAITQAGLTNASVREFMDDESAAGNVSLTDPEVIAGLNALVGGGLLTQDRATAILAGSPPPKS